MTAWQSLDVDEVITQQETGHAGLTLAEATTRLERFGRNELEQIEPPSALTVWFNQFKSLMIGFLAVCAVITAIKAEWIDTIAIVVVLLLNAVVGFWQERKAESDVRALQSLSSKTARVVRDGQISQIDAAELAPGDIVQLESGDRTPADIRLIDVNGLRVDESMMTGEVLPVDKNTEPVGEKLAPVEQKSMAFAGTLVVAGRATGVVVKTGGETELGAINDLVQGPPGKTPLQVLTAKLEKYIAGVVLGAAILIAIGGIIIGTPASEMFRAAVALIVSAMPEALPVVLTVAMGVGVSQMAAHRAVVRRLPSVETLGSTTVIGSDKTGTLTQNRLAVETVWTEQGTAPLAISSSDVVSSGGAKASALQHGVLRAGALTNEARPSQDSRTGYIGDAVDIAMLSAAVDAGAVDLDDGSSQVIAEQPYEPELGYSQTLRHDSNGYTLYAKGAPEKIIEFCHSIAGVDGPRPIDKQAVLDANSTLAADGLRVIATASVKINGSDVPSDGTLPTPYGMELQGLQAMVDPPREGVPEAVASCREAGIHVMMITGDNPITATAIGERLGLDTTHAPITGAELADMDADALLGRLEKTSIAARMTPQDKLRIVETLQAEGETMAVTGDGVNDAPALRAASIGVAMGASGTDVARESADVVLTDDNFATIVQAVEQGRVTFATIRKATFFLLSSSVATLMAVAVNTFSAHPLIFLPVAILWMNVVMNGLQDVALAFEPGEGDELEQKPRSKSEGVLNGMMWARTAMTGAIMGVITLVTFIWSLDNGMPLDQARTLAITALVFANFFQVFNARTERRSIFTINPMRNKLLLIAAVGSLIMHWGATSWGPAAHVFGFAALTPGQWAVCLGLGAILLAVVEIEKLIRRMIRRSKAVAK